MRDDRSIRTASLAALSRDLPNRAPLYAVGSALRSYGFEDGGLSIGDDETEGLRSACRSPPRAIRLARDAEGRQTATNQV